MYIFVLKSNQMYKGTITKKLECLIHVIYWLLISYFTFVKNPIGAHFSTPDLFLWTYFIVFVLTFYFHYLIVMKKVFKAFNWKRLLMGVTRRFTTPALQGIFQQTDPSTAWL